MANAAQNGQEDVLEQGVADELATGKLRRGQFSRILGLVTGRKAVLPELGRHVQVARQPPFEDTRKYVGSHQRQ